MKSKTQRHITPRLDRWDWFELFTQFRENATAHHVVRVARIVELLKVVTDARGFRAVQVHAELNGRLKHYRWQSVISPTSQGVMEFLRPPAKGECPQIVEWEYKTVRELLNLFRERGELDRVHLCERYDKREGCEGWFYGPPNKTWCSRLCYQHHHDNDETVKAARRVKNAKRNTELRARQKKAGERAKRIKVYKHRA